MNRIFTNNPVVADAFPDAAHFIDGDVADVFTAVRDAVHKGAHIRTHPLSGGVKPWENPYKSIAVLMQSGAVDFASLQYIEDAAAVLRKRPPASHAYDASVLEDFRIIDLDLIQNAIM